MKSFIINIFFVFMAAYAATSQAQTATPTAPTPPATVKQYNCQFMCQNLNSLSTTKVPTTPSTLEMLQKPAYNFSCEFDLTTSTSSCDSDTNPIVKNAIALTKTNCKAMNVAASKDNVKPLFLYCLEKF